MKVALIADTHWGNKNDDETQLAYMTRFMREEFFPGIQGVDLVVHAGDLVDRRKYAAYRTIETMRRQFLEPLADMDVPVEIVVGNHDATFKNTNLTNALNELVDRRYHNMRTHDTATQFTYGDTGFCLVPWLAPDNMAKSMELVEQTKATICVGHLELNGFKMYSSTPVMDHGMDPRVFSKFKLTASGHFHHRSNVGSIVYLGAPYEMNWHDAGDPRGYHILDTETMDLEFFPSKLRLFRKVHYADGQVTQLENIEGQVVKVIVHSREDGAAFDAFMKVMEAQRPADIQIVDDHLNLDVAPKETVGEVKVEDTREVLRQSVEEVEGDWIDKPHLTDLLMELHDEAVSRR